MNAEYLQKTDFSLVLSGGGALGIAHLGVLHDMENLTLTPKEIIGTSMGGIIGACKAIGMTEAQIHEKLKAFSSLTKWMKFSLSGNAIIENSRIEQIFQEIFGDRTMSQTETPLKLIATNLLDGNKRVFSGKDNIFIKDALLATMAIPGIFNEHEISGKIYGDGFLCENLGINEAEYDTLLAVDVLGKHSFESAMPDNFFKTANVLEMFERSMRLLIYNQTQAHLRCNTKNILLIEPATRDYKTFQFHKFDEIRALGLGLLR
jgi:NTE family protein